MTPTKQILNRVDLRNKNTTDKNIRIANAIEGIFDLALHMDGHIKSMGILECIKNIDNYEPSSSEMEEIANTMWMIAEQSTDSFEEAIGVIACVQLELQWEFNKSNESGGHVQMSGFIKNQNYDLIKN